MECQNQTSSQINPDHLSDNKISDEGERTLNRDNDKAIAYLKNQRFGEAIALLESNLLQAIEKYGEDTPELAKHYFNLGSALLSQVYLFTGNLTYNQTSLQVENSREVLVSAPAPENQHEEQNASSQPQEKALDYDSQKENMNNDEEPEDIELAWEHLELARVYTEMKLNLLKDEGKIEEISDTMKFLAVIHTKLGDLSFYQENFKEALIDYENCLRLRKFDEDRFYSRRIAEAFYLIGQANLGINTKEADDVAIMNFHKARIILENVLSRIYGEGVKKDPENKQEHKSSLRKEFLHPNIFEDPETTELKSILLDLYNKIEDTIQQVDERDLVDNEKIGDFLLEKNTQELNNTFGKLTFADSLSTLKRANSLTKPGQNNNQIHTEGQANPTKLGVFGTGVRKRTRQELPIIPEKSEDSLKNSNHSEDITKVDEFGKPEKLIKAN